MSRKVLVVDDEKLIVKGIRYSLEQDGMEVDCAYDGEEALKLARENEYDILLLDVMLPKRDGFEVCQQIREFSDVPIVMLTAKGDDMDKILGLEYGADDYITKPFNILEVKARIKAIMRRTGRHKEERPGHKLINAGEMEIDCESRRVRIGRPGDQSDGQGVRPSGASGHQSGQSIQQGKSSEHRMGLRVSRRCTDGGRTYPEAAGEDRDQSKRSEVCLYQVGSGLLFQGLKSISRSVFSKVFVSGSLS